MDRVKEDMEGRLRILKKKKREKSQEEKIKELEDRLKGLEGKTTGSTSKPMESERQASTKEVPTELKGVSTGMGDLYKDAYETFHKGNLEGLEENLKPFSNNIPTQNSLTMPSFGSERLTI